MNIDSIHIANSAILVNPSVTILINACFEAERPELEAGAYFSREFLKINNDRGEFAAKGINQADFPGIPLISVILRRSDPVASPVAHTLGTATGAPSVFNSPDASSVYCVRDWMAPIPEFPSILL